MAGTGAKYVLTCVILTSEQLYEMSTIIIPICQERKQKDREAK